MKRYNSYEYPVFHKPHREAVLPIQLSLSFTPNFLFLLII